MYYIYTEVNPKMSRKHGFCCDCSECGELNSLSGKGFDTSAQMLDAVKKGKSGVEIDLIVKKLEELNSKTARLAIKLGR